MVKLIFGCGYLGQRVADRWLRAGDTVYALTRSAARAQSLQAAGLRPLVGEILQPETLRDLPAAETVLFAVGYERGARGSMREVYVDGLRHVLQALPPGTGRLIYVSSTGVYGQEDGSWVDEGSPCVPARAGGAACWEAERLLLASSWAEQAVVLRMSGMYGPGRIPRRRELEAGRPLAAPSAGFLNLVHVADAARAVLAVEQDAPLPQVYCVSDGQPVVRGEYYRYLAELLGAPAPIFTEPPTDSPAALRAGASKRVSSERFRQRFAFRFEYPTYREGLAAIVAAESR
jgi:nucleoside-diphosphate-sugar epimerase